MTAITKEHMDAWAARTSPGRYLARLEQGDTMPWSRRAHPTRYYSGPAVVEVVRFRDGSWEAYEAPLISVADFTENTGESRPGYCPATIRLAGHDIACSAPMPHGDGAHLF